MQIFRKNLSSSALPQGDTTLENPPRPASAPPKLSGSDSPFKVVEPNKNPITIPSAAQINQTKSAYNDYIGALAQQEDVATSCWSQIFGSSNTKDVVKKSLDALSHVYEEEFFLDQAVRESKREFRQNVIAGGGNPAIAEAVFESTMGIRDTPVPPPHHSIQQIAVEKKLSSQKQPTELSTFSTSNNAPSPIFASPDQSDDDENSDPFGILSDVESEPEIISKNLEKEIHPSLSLEKFYNDLGSLSQKEIAEFILSLPPSDRIQLAKGYFDPDLHEMLDGMAPSELEYFLITTFLEINKEAQAKILLTDPRAQDAISTSFLRTPVPIEHQGLYNSGVDCYLNSALQCLKDQFSNLPLEDQQLLLQSLRNRYQSYVQNLHTPEELVTATSPLVAFLEGKFDGRNHFAASLLRKEVRRIMEELSESGSNASGAAINMAENINPTNGNSRQQCDTSEALIALMEYVGTPTITIKEIDTYRAGDPKAGQRREAPRGHDEGNFILPFGVSEKPTSVVEMIHTNWSADLDDIEDPHDFFSKHNICRERFLLDPPASMAISLARFRMKPDPAGGWAKNSRGEDIVGVPRLALDHNGNSIPEKLHTSISRLTDDISFPTYTEDGAPTQTRYTPTSIICHYGRQSASSGHYATYLKKNEEWFLVNDSQVTQVHLDTPMAEGAPMTHRTFLEQNAYVINFKKME